MVTVSSTQSLPDNPLSSFDEWLSGRIGELGQHNEQRLRSAFDQMQRLYAAQAGESTSNFGKAQSVGAVLLELGLDSEAVTAGLLHDIPALRKQGLKWLAAEYGDTIAGLVQGANRVAAIGTTEQPLHYDDQAQSEALRKMILAMARDVRVMFIALAERLIAMRGLNRLPQARQHQLARQTLQLHASLANRLGVSRLKWELEDLSLRALEPETYHQIAQRLALKRQAREAAIQALRGQLTDALTQAGIDARVDGRPKHIYSIWRKMQKKHLHFDGLFDIRALRVRVNTIKQCYEALSIAHTLWPNNAAEYDDYIAAPKANNYQSLHTVVTAPDGQSLEIQFRTHEMNEQAELGVAAHWRYKEGGCRDANFDARVSWLRELLQWAQDEAGGYGAMSAAGADMFDDHVFAFTPQGDILDLQRGATPLDFAYRIHTQVGHRCRGARVNDQMVPLTRQLETGDRVEVLTVAQAGPSRDWANPARGYLTSKQARASVQHWFRNRDLERDAAAGRAILERALRRAGGAHPPSQKTVAQLLHFSQPTALLAALGRGEVTEARVAAVLRRQQNAEAPESTSQPSIPTRHSPAASQAGAVVVGGVDNLLTRLAACCRPVMGDAIVGFITRRNGMAIHRRNCPNVTGLDASARERIITAQWGAAGDRRYPADVVAWADDGRAFVDGLSSILGSEQVPLLAAVPHTKRHDQADEVDLQLGVHDTDQLERLMNRIGNMRGVHAVRRALTA